MYNRSVDTDWKPFSIYNDTCALDITNCTPPFSIYRPANLYTTYKHIYIPPCPVQIPCVQNSIYSHSWVTQLMRYIINLPRYIFIYIQDALILIYLHTLHLYTDTTALYQGAVSIKLQFCPKHTLAPAVWIGSPTHSWVLDALQWPFFVRTCLLACYKWLHPFVKYWLYLLSISSINGCGVRPKDIWIH